jgi:hypothetical protein
MIWSYVNSRPLTGRRYTWSNERESPTLERLDRVFCSVDWETAHPNSLLTCVATLISDHCPLVLHTVIQRSSDFSTGASTLSRFGHKFLASMMWSKLLGQSRLMATPSLSSITSYALSVVASSPGVTKMLETLGCRLNVPRSSFSDLMLRKKHANLAGLRHGSDVN